MAKVKDPHSPSRTVHWERHGRPAEYVRSFPSGERGYCDPHPSKVAGEPLYHQGQQAERRDCQVLGRFRCKHELGGTGVFQERDCSGGGVEPSRNVHE